MSCTIQLILYIFVEFSVVDACLLLRVLRSEFSELSCGLLGLINVTEHFLKAMDICTAPVSGRSGWSRRVGLLSTAKQLL